MTNDSCIAISIVMGGIFLYVIIALIVDKIFYNFSPYKTKRDNFMVLCWPISLILIFIHNTYLFLNRKK